MSLCFLFSMLADKLNMSPEEAERWIVNLIRNARLDAKIDSKLVRPAVIFLYQSPQYLMIESNSPGSSDSHITFKMFLLCYLRVTKRHYSCPDFVIEYNVRTLLT